MFTIDQLISMYNNLLVPIENNNGDKFIRLRITHYDSIFIK